MANKKEATIELGDLAKDELTGFEGIVVGRTAWLTNCDRLVLQPRELDKDGAPQKTAQFDIMHCKLVQKGVVPQGERPWETKDEIALGDSVRHDITGFVGVVTARTRWLASADLLLVSPTVLKDGQPQDSHWLNPGQLTLVKKLNPPAPKEVRGGPMPEARRLQDAKR
jgi:heat shock protein HspQ